MSQNRSSQSRPPQNRPQQNRNSQAKAPQQKRFKIRAQHVNSGKITTELLTKKQIAVGFDDRDLNIEDIGIALLNDLRESMGLEPIEADFENEEHDNDDESEEDDE